eukprot:6427531-Amphidinium_carterae.1
MDGVLCSGRPARPRGDKEGASSEKALAASWAERPLEVVCMWKQGAVLTNQVDADKQSQGPPEPNAMQHAWL